MRIEPADVLLVIDVQNDFLPGGALAVPDGDAVIAPVNRLAARFPHVVLTQDWHPPGHVSFASSHAGRRPFETVPLPYGTQVLWPDHCVRGTAGAALAAGLPEDVVRVAESGVESEEQIRSYAAAGADAVLVGEALVRHGHPEAALRAFRAASLTVR